jgi:hypothetical protein
MFDRSVVLTDGYDADEGAMMFNGEGKIWGSKSLILYL